MALRLRGATSGYIELKAPASAGDNTLTLPTNNGSANQLLKTDGSGNLSWVDDNSGVSLSGSTNNTIATVTGANALIGEANLTFDGELLTINGGTTDTPLIINCTNAGGPHMRFQQDGATKHYVGCGTGIGGLGDKDDFTIRAYDNINFATNNTSTSRLKIDATGNVGIGTTSPEDLLHIKTGKIRIENAIVSNNDSTISYDNDTFLIDIDPNNVRGSSKFQIKIDTVAGLTIDDNRKVGIGTTSPSQELTVYGSDPIISIQEASVSSQVDIGTGTSTGFINVQKADGTRTIQLNGSADSYFTGGNIGIGTTSPGSQLHIKNTSGAAILNLEASANGGEALFKAIGKSGGGDSRTIQFRYDSGGDAGRIITAENIPIQIMTQNTTRVHVKGDGDVGIGTTSPAHKLHIIDGAGTSLRLGNTTNASTAGLAYNWGGSFGLKCDPDDNAGGTKHIYMQVIGTTFFNLSSTGKVTCTGVNSLTTTGGSAVYVESDGDLLRYTSSRKYKTDIETAEDKYADEILTCRPVWYRSTSTNDIKNSSKTKSDFGWFGFIAEEIAEINPRLVNYKTKESQQQSDGTLKSVELDPSAYEAESVRYTDFIPLMVNLLKRQAAKIETLETKVAALESA
jgi:hypothetical protein